MAEVLGLSVERFWVFTAWRLFNLTALLSEPGNTPKTALVTKPTGIVFCFVETKRHAITRQTSLYITFWSF